MLNSLYLAISRVFHIKNILFMMTSCHWTNWALPSAAVPLASCHGPNRKTLPLKGSLNMHCWASLIFVVTDTDDLVKFKLLQRCRLNRRCGNAFWYLYTPEWILYVYKCAFMCGFELKHYHSTDSAIYSSRQKKKKPVIVFQTF